MEILGCLQPFADRLARVFLHLNVVELPVTKEKPFESLFITGEEEVSKRKISFTMSGVANECIIYVADLCGFLAAAPKLGKYLAKMFSLSPGKNDSELRPVSMPTAYLPIHLPISVTLHGTMKIKKVLEYRRERERI